MSVTDKDRFLNDLKVADIASATEVQQWLASVSTLSDPQEIADKLVEKFASAANTKHTNDTILNRLTMTSDVVAANGGVGSLLIPKGRQANREAR